VPTPEPDDEELPESVGYDPTYIARQLALRDLLLVNNQLLDITTGEVIVADQACSTDTAELEEGIGDFFDLSSAVYPFGIQSIELDW
jgi:hypothetical protein